MKHFIITVNYTASLERMDQSLQAHRSFLQQGYDKGWLLCSGRQNPPVGGLIVGRAPSLEELKAFFAEDPFVKESLASYSYIEFNPVKFQPFMQDWVTDPAGV